MKFNIDILEKYLNDKLLQRQNHPDLPLLIWNYAPKVQYERLWDDITLKCRALITNYEGEVVAKSFDKFFNIEEVKDLPNEKFQIYEKMDGSLIVFFWLDNELVVSSKGSFTSEHAIEAKKILQKYDLSKFDKSKSYSAELIAPWNRIVCNYGNEEKLVLLAKFDKFGNEYEIDKYKNEIEIVKRYDIFDLENIKSLIKDEQEGFVVKFDSGYRVKVKGSEYIRLHKIVTEISEKVIFEYLSEGQNIENLIEKVPDEFYNWVKSVENKFSNSYKSILNECKSVYRELEDRKETAKYFLNQKYPEILFKMLDKKQFEKLIWKNVKRECLSNEENIERHSL
jgi:RNA ligase